MGKLFCYRFFLHFTSVAALAAVVLWGCPEGRETPKSSETIRIGVLYPLSGEDAVSGEDLKAGVELAVEMVNNRFDLPLPLAKEPGLSGKSGRKIELVIRDTKADPVTAAKSVEELVKKERVVAVMGCWHSRVTAMASEQAEILHVPFLNGESCCPHLIQRGLKWFFQTTPDDSLFSDEMFNFINEIRKSHPAASTCPVALVYENGMWGTGVAQAHKRMACLYHYPIAADIPYNENDDDFNSEIEKLTAAMPAFVLHASYTRDSLVFIKAYQNLQVKPLAVIGMNAGFISPQFIPELGEDAEGIFSREVWAVDWTDKNATAKAVDSLFLSRNHHHMTGGSARAFTALMVLGEAIDRAKTLEPKEIRKALSETELRPEEIIMPWEGIRFDPETGKNVLGKGIIVQVQNGRYTTVWPKPLAARPPIWPDSNGCSLEK